MVLLNLRAQILISLNARLFKVFNLRDNKVFTISLLKNILGSSFHVPEHLIQFTLVSGRYTKDSDALVDLRASDGNFASLDVGVLPPHYCSSLSEAIVSFEFRANPTPTYLDGVSVAGIQEIPLMYQTLRPVSDRLNNELNNLNISNKKLTKDQRIALRARYEDPFSISSKSCFEEDSDDDSLYEDEDSESELGDSDDDLYSDDEVESTGFTESRSAFSNYEACHKADSGQYSSFWSSDSSKLNPYKLRQLLSVVPNSDSHKEIPLRESVLRLQFQTRVYNHLIKTYNHQSRSSTSSDSSSSSISSQTSSLSSSSMVSNLSDHESDESQLYSENYQNKFTNATSSIAQKPTQSKRKQEFLKILIPNKFF